jgi:hypothetical protein
MGCVPPAARGLGGKSVARRFQHAHSRGHNELSNILVCGKTNSQPLWVCIELILRRRAIRRAERYDMVGVYNACIVRRINCPDTMGIAI